MITYKGSSCIDAFMKDIVKGRVKGFSEIKDGFAYEWSQKDKTLEVSFMDSNSTIIGSSDAFDLKATSVFISLRVKNDPFFLSSVDASASSLKQIEVSSNFVTVVFTNNAVTEFYLL